MKKRTKSQPKTLPTASQAKEILNYNDPNIQMSRKKRLRLKNKADSIKKRQKLAILAEPEFDLPASLPNAPEATELISVFDESLSPSKRAFNSPEELIERFRRYLVWTYQYKKPMTLERCALFLGIDSHNFRRYMNKDEYAPVIKRIREFILSDKVERLNYKQAVTGIIFDLKNNEGWQDKSEIDVKGEVTFVGKLREAVAKSKALTIESQSEVETLETDFQEVREDV